MNGTLTLLDALGVHDCRGGRIGWITGRKEGEIVYNLNQENFTQKSRQKVLLIQLYFGNWVFLNKNFDSN